VGAIATSSIGMDPVISTLGPSTQILIFSISSAKLTGKQLIRKLRDAGYEPDEIVSLKSY